jgi:hypothetical protein
MAGLPLKPDQHTIGVSVASILLGQRDHVYRSTLFWHCPHSCREGAMHSGDRKLRLRYETGSRELRSLHRELGGRQDLAANELERVVATEVEHRA